MKQYVVDAFADRVFGGNPAAVCVLDKPISDDLMQKIAIENNLSETAFAVREGEWYRLRWFTPGGEINLCGHATLAAGYALFRFFHPDWPRIVFHTMSGDLYVRRDGDLMLMDFPAFHCHKVPVTPQMCEALGAAPAEAYLDRDLLLVYENAETVKGLAPDFEKTKALDGYCVGVTAPGDGYDCVSRFFAPKLKVPEDPVTGSVHCMIAPYWADRLGKSEITAYQASPRGGMMRCRILPEDRVEVAGYAALFSVADLFLPE